MMKNKLKTIGIFLFFVIVFIFIWAVVANIKYKEPNIQRILDSSKLKNNVFSANIEEIHTESGIKAYLISEKNNPIVSISFIFRHKGNAYENDKNGIANFVADMLTEGTKNLSPEEYVEFLKQNGVKISFGADYDDFRGQFTFPVSTIQDVLPVLKDTLFSPRFEQKEINLLKQKYALIFASQNENEKNFFQNIARPIVYENHPYSRNPLGDENVIKYLSAADLWQYIQDGFAKDNLIIGIAGGVDADAASKIIDVIFADLPEKNQNNMISKVNRDYSYKEHKIKQDFAQTMVQIVAEGVYRNSKDFYPLYIANHIFGGSGLTSRINTELRTKRGLTYGAYTTFNISDNDAILSGFFSTANENFADAVKILKEEWQKFGREGITKEEFIKTKNYLISSFNLRFDSTFQIAEMLSEIQKYDLGKDFLQKRNDYVNAVTFDEVNMAIKKYFNNNFIIISVGNFDDEK